MHRHIQLRELRRELFHARFIPRPPIRKQHDSRRRPPPEPARHLPQRREQLRVRVSRREWLLFGLGRTARSRRRLRRNQGTRSVSEGGCRRRSVRLRAVETFALAHASGYSSLILDRRQPMSEPEQLHQRMPLVARRLIRLAHQPRRVLEPGLLVPHRHALRRIEQIKNIRPVNRPRRLRHVRRIEQDQQQRRDRHRSNPDQPPPPSDCRRRPAQPPQ